MQSLSNYWIIPGVWASSFHLLFLPSKHCQDVLTTHEGTPLSDHANCHKQRSSYSLWLTHPRYHHQLINSCSVIITSSVSTSKILARLIRWTDSDAHQHHRRTTYVSSSSLLNRLPLIYLTHHNICEVSADQHWLLDTRIIRFCIVNCLARL